jgi:tetratricopeptide (TPR) repeat protein
VGGDGTVDGRAADGGAANGGAVEDSAGGGTVDQAAGWADRSAELWARFDRLPEAEFLASMEELVAQLPADDPSGPFELGGAFDATGHTDRAVPLYDRALRLGLSGIRRRQAVIQMASSLRDLGRPQESVALLGAELAAGSDQLDDAIRAFLALALADVGREREAVALSIGTLAPHLAFYQRSLANYAQQLMEPAREA